MKRWTVYCHTLIADGRRYIGLTSQTMEARWKKHVYAAFKFSKGGRWHFPNAIRKYGKDAFSHEVLEVCDDLGVANLAEECWIELLDTRDPERGFNLAKGGAHVPHSIRKNPWNDPEYRSKNLPRLKTMGQTAQARANNKISHNTPESKVRQSVAARKAYAQPGARARLSTANTGKVMNSDSRAKISAALRTRPRKTHCKHGHSLEDAHIVNRGNRVNNRKCRVCKSIRDSKRKRSTHTHAEAGRMGALALASNRSKATSLAGE